MGTIALVCLIIAATIFGLAVFFTPTRFNLIPLGFFVGLVGMLIEEGTNMTKDEATTHAIHLEETGLIQRYDIRPSYPQPRKLADVTSWDVAVLNPIGQWILLRNAPAIILYEEHQRRD